MYPLKASAGDGSLRLPWQGRASRLNYNRKVERRGVEPRVVGLGDLNGYLRAPP